MHVLVTGATGFVGNAVARRFLDDGCHVHALIREPSSRDAGLEQAGARIFVGDVGQPDLVADAADGCEVVVHCAAVPTPRAADRALRWVNIAGTENVVAAVRHAGCRRIVHLSCADVTLANLDRIHWREDHGLRHPPMDAHARSKRLAEDIALAANRPGLEITALRPAWLWGPGDHTRLPALCREGLQGGIRLFGNGRNLFSTTYIDNLVDAVRAASEAEHAAGHAYYITDGAFQDAGEFFSELSESLGLPPPRRGRFWMSYAGATLGRHVGRDTPSPGEVVKRARGSLFDIQHAHRDLGYQPRCTIADGMQALATWVRNVGGPQAVIGLERPAATAASVDAQVEAAGGD